MIRIEEIETAYGTINIFKKRSTGAMIYELGGRNQSAADANGISLASYIHAIFGLLSQAKARSILLIGGGGGTLGTMLARMRCEVTIADVNPISFTLAKRYFGLPEEVTCQVADGKAFLRADPNKYDAIVLDAFHGEHIPSHLLSSAFFELARDHLAPHGILLVNVHVKHDFDDFADRVAKTMRGAWADVRLLDTVGTCDRNAIVMAGEVSRLRPPALLVRPQTDVRLIKEELARMQFRPWKSSRWDFGH
jgi:spermidine synthase